VTSEKHAGAVVQGSEPKRLTPRGLPVGTYRLVEVDITTGQPVGEVRVRVEGWPYFTPGRA
jgi:hypothetical protein